MKIYIALNKQIWERVKAMLSGVVFSREENGIYYLKMPEKYATQLLLTGLIKEHGTNH